jgi:CRISPR type I-E-associated protein CasA/Cse1
MGVPKKIITKNEKPSKKEKSEPEHNFSFNLLDNPWLPVVNHKGEKEFLSVNEFLNKAHELERFDFPLPGLETAVIRFFVALVHIVGAPETLKDWENSLLSGKFEKKFSKELNDKYYNKFDLFSKTEPFMQEKQLAKLQEASDGIDRLINFNPYATNQIHWNHLFVDSKDRITGISPSFAIIQMLLANMTMMAGGAGYKPGINGVPPVYVLLKGENLFKSIYLNVINNKLSQNVSDQNQLKVNEEGFPLNKKGELSAKQIDIQTGILWKSRDLLLIPTVNSNMTICSLSGKETSIVINKIFFKPQSVSLKKDSFWYDPMIIKNDLGAKGLKKLTVQNYELPPWKEYPSLINTKGRDYKKKKVFPPLIIKQISEIKANKRPKTSVSILSIATDYKAKIFQINEKQYFFNSEFIDDEEAIQNIELLVTLIEEFEYYLKLSFVLCFKIHKNSKPPSFQSAYWHEIGSEFEETLNGLSTKEDSNLVIVKWREMLVEHVRKTFNSHTEKLITNPKNLKQYENGRKYLERMIYSKLLFHKKNKESK